MKKGIGLKVLAVLIALLIVVSGVTPCIVASNPTNNAVSKGMIQPIDTIHAQHRMPFSSLTINGYDLMKDANAAFSNEEFAAESTAPEEERNKTSQYTGFSGGIPPAPFPSSLNMGGASYLQVKKVSANSRIIFLDTCKPEDAVCNISIFNTEWDGYSDLANLLRDMGFTVEERDIYLITYNQIKDYDVIVITGSDQRAFSSSEVDAIVDHVRNGGGLVLLGNHGFFKYAHMTHPTLNAIGSYFGIGFEYDLICDPTDHCSIPDDPDGGVDVPVIHTFNDYPILEDVETFELIWGDSLKISSPAKVVATGDLDTWCDQNPYWNGEYLVCQYDSGEPVGYPPVMAIAEYDGGRVVAIGDTDMWVNSWLPDYDHKVLAENTFEWVLGEEEKPDLATVEDALDQYQQRVNRFFDDYAKKMAESDAKVYKNLGEEYSNLVINYYGYKAKKIGDNEIPAQFKNAMDFITKNTSYNNKTRMSKLYYFYKEMFSAVNIQMSEEQIKSIFYAYYLGTAPNQHYFFFGEKGFKQILDDYDIKLNLHKQEFLDNINSSDLSENDLNNIVIGILRATNSTDEYNRLFENFDDISDAYINGDVTDVRLVRNQENFVVTVPVMLGIYLGGAIITSYGAAYVTSAAAPLLISGVTAFGHQILSVASSSLSGLTNQPAISTVLRGFDADNARLLMNEFFVRKMQTEAYNRANDFADFIELIDKVEDLDDIEIIELYAPNITFADPADPSGTMGKQHGYMKIRNNGIDSVKVDLDIYIKEPSYIETTVYNSSIVLSPSGTKNITFYYSVNLEELEEDGICGFYSLTAQVTYKIAYSAMSIGIEVLQPGTFIEVDTPLSISFEFLVDDKTIYIAAYDASDSSTQNLISNTDVKKIAEDQISEGNEISYNVNVPADSDRTVFRLNYPGSDLDLHVYDQFDNHVGMNYDTGQIETQILGVTYSGADFNPEWIRIDGHQNEHFKLKTIALSTLENESFSIYSINTREVPATLSIKPPKISLAGYAQESITQNIIITEIGGFNDLSGISITASDLTDGMGGVIPSSNLILDMPSTDISAGSAMIVNLTIDIPTDVVEGRTYSGVITAEDDSGAIDNASVNVVILAPDLTVIFDTGSGSYPSIMGTHMGTITPNQDVTVSKLYTYPCSGTGGHTEYVRIYGTGIDKSTSWNGYVEDWHNITFDDSFILEAGKTYNYELITGSYPQIHHTDALLTANGWINCTEFTDVNGKKYDNWILAIRLFS